DEPGGRIDPGEEVGADVGRQRTGEVEVIPFEDGANRRGDDDFPLVAGHWSRAAPHSSCHCHARLLPLLSTHFVHLILLFTLNVLHRAIRLRSKFGIVQRGIAPGRTIGIAQMTSPASLAFVVADDHPMVREALASALGQAFGGSTLATAASLAQSEALLEGDPETDGHPLELRMAGMDGKNGLRALRRLHP